MTPTAHMSVAYPIGSKPTTSGATNSGVPNKTCNFFIGSNFRASPKSIIFIMLPLFDKHNMFSGYGINKNVKKVFRYYFQTYTKKIKVDVVKPCIKLGLIPTFKSR